MTAPLHPRGDVFMAGKYRGVFKSCHSDQISSGDAESYKFRDVVHKAYADARCGWLHLAAARKCLLRLTEGDDGPDDFCERSRKQRSPSPPTRTLHIPAATSSASLLRA
jgi:hypothetical protein